MLKLKLALFLLLGVAAGSGNASAQTIVFRDQNGDVVPNIVGPVRKNPSANQQLVNYWDGANGTFWPVDVRTGEAAFLTTDNYIQYETSDCTGQAFTDYSAENEVIYGAAAGDVYSFWIPGAAYEPAQRYAWVGVCSPWWSMAQTVMLLEPAAAPSIPGVAPYYRSAQ